MDPEIHQSLKQSAIIIGLILQDLLSYGFWWQALGCE
jgi:hypothetical protein